MAQVIMMSRRYNQKPSQVVNIEEGYAAYCFDEAAFYMEMHALDRNGEYRWNRFKWKGHSNKANKDLIEFIQKHSR
jgi:hypothetical protein